MPQFFLPPEWSPQSGLMITWPHPHSDWRDLLPEVEPVYALIARQVTRREGLLVNCWDQAHIAQVKSRLQDTGADPRNVIYSAVRSNDTWTRDYGPITVLEDGRPRLLDFIFNGWGGKFDAALDNQVTRNLHRDGVFGPAALDSIDMVLEGGSIEVDGRGTLLTTEHCLLAPTRNPGLDRVQIEERLRGWFGVTNVLWLRHGHLAGDDTDSHIDTLARFCDSHTIAYVACDDPHDEHYAELRSMEAELRACRDLDGRPYRLVPLPWPAAKHDAADGRRLAASYANFLIINGAVLMPLYDDPADDEALRRLQSCFADREVVGVPCLPLIRQNGSLHCITMQLPAGVL
ncbi:MAG: agmatine deiminase family protein [Gammaproteobacteria bacterium]